MTYRIPGEWQDEPIAKGPGLVERVATAVGRRVRRIWSVAWPAVAIVAPSAILIAVAVGHSRFLDSVTLRCMSEGLAVEKDINGRAEYLNTGREVFAVCIDADKKRVLRRVP